MALDTLSLRSVVLPIDGTTQAIVSQARQGGHSGGEPADLGSVVVDPFTWAAGIALR